MDKAAKTRTRRFVLAVILSVMLVAGIPMIIVGAIGPDEGHGAMHAARIGYKVMMGIGIVFTDDNQFFWRFGIAFLIALTGCYSSESFGSRSMDIACI